MIRIKKIRDKNKISLQIIFNSGIIVQSVKCILFMMCIAYNCPDGSRRPLKYKSVFHERFPSLNIYTNAITIICCMWEIFIKCNLSARELCINIFNPELRFVHFMRKIIPLIHQNKSVVQRHIQKSVVVLVHFIMELARMRIQSGAPLFVE